MRGLRLCRYVIDDDAFVANVRAGVQDGGSKEFELGTWKEVVVVSRRRR